MTRKASKHIRRISKARAKQQAEYAKMKGAFLKNNRCCWKCGRFTNYKDRDLHHFFGRVGRLLAWEPGFRMVCRTCHDAIHRYPYACAEFLAPKGLWNDYDKAVKFHRQNYSLL